MALTLAEIDAEIAKRQEQKDLNSAVDAEIAKRLAGKDKKGVLQELESAFQQIPGMPVLSEYAAGFNRPALGALDFLGPDNINAILNLAGSESRVPTFTETFGSEGGFMEPGLARDIVSGAGEVSSLALSGGAAIRQAAQSLPKLVAPGAETTAAGLLRQAAGTTAKQDVALGAASGAGTVIGEKEGGPIGGMVGSVLAPIGTQAAGEGLKAILKLGGKGISTLMKSVGQMSDEGASELLSRAMVAEGIPPELIAQRLKQLGPEALPADLGEDFSRLLRAASNKVPRIKGRAKDVLNQRHAGQSDRVMDALDDASGTSFLSVDDEIARLDALLKPQINKLYAAAREKSEQVFSSMRKPTTSAYLGGPSRGGVSSIPKKAPSIDELQPSRGELSALGMGIEPSPTPHLGGALSKGGVTSIPPSKNVAQRHIENPTLIEQLLAGKPAAGFGPKKKADLELTAKRLSGEPVTKLDIIDANKRGLDDQIKAAIRLGENNKARSLVKIKNVLVDEADKAIPEYKQARSLFAGKATLENAADNGELFLKMKPRDIQALTKTMGESEKKMFKLGAKRALLDKVDDLQVTADTVKRMFGKTGDAKKLRSLFDDESSFIRFNEALERESQFVLTRRAAQGNSTTVEQAADISNAEEALGHASSLFGNPVQSATAFGKILGGLSGKKGTEVNIRSLEKAGDILLTSGMNPKKVQAMVRKAAPNEIENALRKIMIKPVSAAPVVGGVSAALDGS